MSTVQVLSDVYCWQATIMGPGRAAAGRIPHVAGCRGEEKADADSSVTFLRGSGELRKDSTLPRERV